MSPQPGQAEVADKSPRPLLRGYRILSLFIKAKGRLLPTGPRPAQDRAALAHAQLCPTGGTGCDGGGEAFPRSKPITPAPGVPPPSAGLQAAAPGRGDNPAPRGRAGSCSRVAWLCQPGNTDGGARERV